MKYFKLLISVSMRAEFARIKVMVLLCVVNLLSHRNDRTGSFPMLWWQSYSALMLL